MHFRSYRSRYFASFICKSIRRRLRHWSHGFWSGVSDGAVHTAAVKSAGLDVLQRGPRDWVWLNNNLGLTKAESLQFFKIGRYYLQFFLQLAGYFNQ